MTPYRASAEPEPEVLWSTPVARYSRRRTAVLAGTIAATLGTTAVALVYDVPAIAATVFAVFLGAATTVAQRTWLFGKQVEVRLERIGAAHRLRITTTSIRLDGPLSLTGSSRLEDGARIVLQLEIRGDGGQRLTFGAIVDPSENVTTRDDWFDGAPLAPTALPGELMVDPPQRLVEMRDAIAKL